MAVIGDQPDDRSDPGSTLVCMTGNINKACCRRGDGARVGKWYYPNGTIVYPLQYYYNYNGQYTISETRYTKQVRLVRRKGNNALGPTGIYTCSVPDEHGNLWNASILITGMDLDFHLTS